MNGSVVDIFIFNAIFIPIIIHIYACVYRQVLKWVHFFKPKYVRLILWFRFYLTDLMANFKITVLIYLFV